MGVNSMNSYEIVGYCNKEDCMNTPKTNKVAEHDVFICMVSILYYLKIFPTLGRESWWSISYHPVQNKFPVKGY